MERISKIFDDTETFSSSPEEWLEERRLETMVACRQVLMDQADVVSYGKTVEERPKRTLEQRINAAFFRRIFDDILHSIPQVSYSRAAKDCRMDRNRRGCRRGEVLLNNKQRNYVPVFCKKSRNTAKYFPAVSKLPALNIEALEDVSRDTEYFVRRFPGVNAYGHGQYFNFAHEAMFSPGPVLLESSMARKDFKKLARNIFVNTKTKTTLVFLGGVEPYRQAKMLFSAAVGATPGLAKQVGMAECIFFYPDLMCAEYDFIGLGLKELLQNNRYGIVDIKIDCIKEGLDRDDDAEDVFRYRKDLINRMPFVVVEICNLAQRLINNGLAITKATANSFAVDIEDNTRPVLTILDCLSPLGYDFKMTERQVRRMQGVEEEVTFSEGAAATEESVNNYPFFQDKNETVYRVPSYMAHSCAPEITNMPTSSGGSRPYIYSDVSEATEASTAYVISKVIKEMLDMATSYDKAVSSDSDVIISCSPAKLLLLSNETMGIITHMCRDPPETRCPVPFLSRVVINLMNVIANLK